MQFLVTKRCMSASGSNTSSKLDIKQALTVEERETLLIFLKLYYTRTPLFFQKLKYLRLAISQDINKDNNQNSDKENDQEVNS